MPLPNRRRLCPIPLLVIFGGSFAASFGFFEGLLEAYTHLQLTWLTGVSANSLEAMVLILSSALCATGAVLGRMTWIASNAPGTEGKQSFDESLVDSLGGALRNRNYAEVIRVGAALTRPLFEAGNFVTRLRIGEIVEEAAALSGRKDAQVVALIDSVGWSLVELGKYEDAKRHIEHGIELSREIGDYFYQAKGQRHLGVIERRVKNYDGALKYYEQSLEAARKINDENQRDVLIAGLHYAFASLYFFTGNFPKAAEFIQKAIEKFTSLNDEYRLNMSYVTKADIEFKQGLKDKSKDTYRKVLQGANKNTEKLQIVRANLGLAEVYISEYNWDKARESLGAVHDNEVRDFKSERERLAEFKSKIPALPPTAS